MTLYLGLDFPPPDIAFAVVGIVRGQTIVFTQPVEALFGLFERGGNDRVISGDSTLEN